jgi:S1-C subfamily serine protease
MPETPEFQAETAEPALEPLVSVKSHVPDDAMSAGLLGTERSGHGIRIRDDGLIVTIGYIVSEAEEIWISSSDNTAAPGIVIGNDFRSGLALIKPTLPLPGAVMELGLASDLAIGDVVTVAGSAGIDEQSIAATVVARQEFAGRWEYVLDDALFTAPTHQSWSGAALMDSADRLCGLGSLVIQGFEVKDKPSTVNMFVPIDHLTPVIDEICVHGRRLAAPRPWLGVLVHDEDNELTIVGVYRNCPADDAGLRPGDIVLEIGEHPIGNLANFFRTVWSLGEAGVDVPLTILRNSKRQEIRIRSSERAAFMRKGTVQ